MIRAQFASLLDYWSRRSPKKHFKHLTKLADTLAVFSLGFVDQKISFQDFGSAPLPLCSGQLFSANFASLDTNTHLIDSTELT